MNAVRPTEEWQQLGEYSYRLEHDLLRCAVHGSGSVVMRAATMLAIGALRIAGAMPRIHLSFFDSASAAEVWLLRERQYWLSTSA